jgi:hypothetical protein
MKNIFYNKYTHKWQNILTIIHFSFLVVFTTSLILVKLYNSWFGKGLFIAAILIAAIYSLFKVIGVKKKDIIEVKNQKS